MSQKVEINGEEVEVFTGAEVEERAAAAAKAKEEEFGKTREQIEKERDEARAMLAQRTQSVLEFRKLNEEQKAKLSLAELALYENQEALHAEREKIAAADKKAYDNAVAASIRAQVGRDDKLFEEVHKMYDLIGLDDSTEDGIKGRVTAAVGALKAQQPDLLATINVTAGGQFEPPKPAEQAQETYADTAAGKELAAKLGLTVEPPKQ